MITNKMEPPANLAGREELVEALLRVLKEAHLAAVEGVHQQTQLWVLMCQGIPSIQGFGDLTVQ